VRLLTAWKGRRTLAALAMTICTTLVLLVPFVVVGSTLADNAKELTAATRKWLEAGAPPPPAWVARIPLVGGSVSSYWSSIAGDSRQLLSDLQPFADSLFSGLLALMLVMTRGLLELALSILISFFLYRDGGIVAVRLRAATERLAGERGPLLLALAGNTVRGVVYGILGTALAQGLIAGIGFFIAGVPGAGMLTLLTFFLSIVPVGPPLVWIPATIWLFHEGRVGWGIFMLIWGLGVSSVDNIIKPWLISKGSDMPFILILLGVLGGAMAFGFIGVFLGPTLLAVGYRLIKEWAIIMPRPIGPSLTSGGTASPESPVMVKE
jgi:predicted PurR-regulated permease PerM